VESWISCTVLMQELVVTTTLQKESCFLFLCTWGNVGPTGTDICYFSKKARSNSATTCENGRYRGLSTQFLVWPNGDWDSGRIVSRAVTITCGSG
jgi:hypothetical protein